MNSPKNRTVIGVICTFLALIIYFAVTPLFNRIISEKMEAMRVVKPVKIREKITVDKVSVVEVSGHSLPKDVARNLDAAIGEFAFTDSAARDCIISSRTAERPAAENAYLHNLTGKKQAISIFLKTSVNGLSGKL